MRIVVEEFAAFSSWTTLVGSSSRGNKHHEKFCTGVFFPESIQTSARNLFFSIKKHYKILPNCPIFFLHSYVPQPWHQAA
jgi:hypothetical protein